VWKEVVMTDNSMNDPFTCLNCDEPVQDSELFCSRKCSDEYERRTAVVPEW